MLNEPKTNQKNVASAGTAELLVKTDPRAGRLIIKAKHANTGMIYIGGSDVSSSNGFVLDAGEEFPLPIDAGEMSIYFDADNTGEGVSYFYWNGS